MVLIPSYSPSPSHHSQHNLPIQNYYPPLPSFTMVPANITPVNPNPAPVQSAPVITYYNNRTD